MFGVSLADIKLVKRLEICSSDSGHTFYRSHLMLEALQMNDGDKLIWIGQEREIFAKKLLGQSNFLIMKWKRSRTGFLSLRWPTRKTKSSDHINHFEFLLTNSLVWFRRSNFSIVLMNWVSYQEKTSLPQLVARKSLRWNYLAYCCERNCLMRLQKKLRCNTILVWFLPKDNFWCNCVRNTL